MKKQQTANRAESIKSVAAQTYHNVEHIIISPKVGEIISTGYSPVLIITQRIEPAYRIKLNVNILFRAQLHICLRYKNKQTLFS